MARLLILGAGISGLVAAYELGKAGYQCKILEASHRAGGRNFTIRHGDFIDELGNPQFCNFDKDPDLYFNAGPARIPAQHTAILHYCREFAVEMQMFCNYNKIAIPRMIMLLAGNLCVSVNTKRIPGVFSVN